MNSTDISTDAAGAVAACQNLGRDLTSYIKDEPVITVKEHSKSVLLASNHALDQVLVGEHREVFGWQRPRGAGNVHADNPNHFPSHPRTDGTLEQISCPKQ